MDGRDRSRSPRNTGGDDDILSLVVQREQARLTKDWAQADALRERLTQLGVTLFDKTNAWRATDGRSGRIPTFSELEAGHTAESLTMIQDQKAAVFVGGAEAGDPAEVTNIKHLVQMREQARAAKDFAQSDKIRDELKALGVELFDKEKMWRAKSGQSGVIIGYRGSAGPTDMEISVLVVQRERARQSGDYATADMIRDELKQFGVDINDKEKVWRSPDGRGGPVPNWTMMGGGGDPLVGAMVGGLAAAPVVGGRGMPTVGGDLRSQVIQAALQAAQNPATAARTLQLLQQVGGTTAGRGQPQVAVSAAKFTAAPAGPTMRSPEARDALNFVTQCQAAGRGPTDQEIEWLVALREKLRQNKDYSSADEIRNAMRSSLGIELHEKEKMWVASDGRQGGIPMWGTIG